MPSTPSERRPSRPTQAPVQEAEHLPCPRCKSTNTKFCYYNNYNLGQPRHFCKSCRRYWTHGGTLRNIPIGGGSRKNSSTKRSRYNSDTTTTTTAQSLTPPCSSLLSVSSSSVPVSCPIADIWTLPAPSGTDIPGSFSFSALLGMPSEEMEALALGESFLGPGELEMGLEDFGVWPLAEVGEGNCLPLPELAVSTPESSFL